MGGAARRARPAPAPPAPALLALEGEPRRDESRHDASGKAAGVETDTAVFRDLLDLMPDGIIVHVPGGEILFANTAAAEMMGVPHPGELLGRLVPDFHSAETREEITRMLGDLDASGLPSARREVQFHRVDGSKTTIETASLPIVYQGMQARLSVARDISEHMRVEEELRESEERFKAFMDYSPVVAFIKDDEHRYLYGNLAKTKFFGMDPDNPAGYDETESMPPEAVRKIQEDDKAVLESGNPLETFEKVPTVDGGLRSFWVYKFPFRGRHGRRLLGGIMVDLTDREKAEETNRLIQEKLRQSVDRFELIARATNDAVWEYHPASGETWWNERLLQLFGDGSPGMKPSLEAWSGRIHPDDKDRVMDSFRKISQGGADTWVREYRYLRSDGGVGHIYERGYVRRGEGGAPEAMLGAMLDITELKRAEAALRENEARLRLLLDQIPALLWSTDAEQRLTSLTGAGLGPLGLKPEELQGRPVSDLAPSAGSHALAGEAHARALGGASMTYHAEWMARVYECHVEPLRSREGAITGTVGFALDITEKRGAEQALRESEERYRRLVELSPDVITVLVDGRVEFANQAALEFLGMDHFGEILGRPALEFFHPDSRQRVLERQVILNAGAAVPPLELKFLRKNGTMVEAESRASPFQFRGKRAALVVIRDITERKRAEAALRGSEEHYRLLFRSNPQPMWVFDMETLRFLDVNDAAQAQYGFSRGEFLAMTIKEIRPPEDIPFLMQKGGKLVMDRESRGVWRHRKKDGALIQVEVLAHRIEFAGRPAAIVLANDITEKIQALDKLRHSEERYRTLAKVSPVGLFRTDLRGMYTYVNERCCLITGFTPEQNEGYGWVRSLHPDDRERVLQEWGKAVALGQPFQSEYRLLGPEGVATWVLGKALPDRGPEGNIIGFVGTLTDITERKQAETLLAGQKRTLGMVASGWPMHEVFEGLVQYVERESAGAAGCLMLIEPDGTRLSCRSAPSLMVSLRKALEGLPLGPRGGAPGAAAEARERVTVADLSGDGQWEWARAEVLDNGFRACTAVPILGSNDQALGAFAFFYHAAGEPPAYDLKLMETAADLAGITIERRRQEDVSRKNRELSEENRRILEASRMKNEFLASMSHELRTPLNAIIGFSQLLIDGRVGSLTHKQEEYLGDILDGGMHLLRLINDVLDLAKIESGKMHLHLEPFPVTQAIREVCDILLPMAMEKAVTLRIAAELEPDLAMLDGQKFKQVLYNLVSNAIKFSLQGGEVIVAAERGENDLGAVGLLLAVTDHGIGIKPEDLGRLFQEFQQLDTGAARHYPGSGLGLVITKKLVELHRGTVGVESAPGQGSVFTAFFPEPDPKPGKE
jgi:PAS domain S-box-containing protein